MKNQEVEFSMYEGMGERLLTWLARVLEHMEDGQRYSVTVKHIRPKRSNQQNKYYWACIGLIAEELGYANDKTAKSTKSEIVDQIHGWFKEKYLPVKTISAKDKRRKKIKLKASTAWLDTKEFKDYMDAIKQDFPFLPDPEGDNMEQFYSAYFWK